VIYELVKSIVTEAPDRPFVIQRAAVCRYRDVLDRARSLAASLARLRLRRLLVCMEDSADLICLLLAADIAGIQIGIVNAGTMPQDVNELVQRTSADAVVVRRTIADLASRQIAFDTLMSSANEEESFRRSGEPAVVIFTTGTTGRPKGAVYRWDDLLAQVRRRGDLTGSTWLLLYNLNHFAGYQILAHVIANAATLVIPETREPRQVLDAMRRWKVSHMSATPTFWRMFVGQIRNADEAGLTLRQITIGGEAVTSDVLQRLTTLFPQACISQVYATTELGACFSVKDGKPGFPSSLLDDASRDVQLKVIDGELHVKSPHSMQSYVGGESWNQGDWKPTGDMVCVQGDRVVFQGRKAELMNVGGVKVHPLEIESIIQEVPGVRWVRVRGQKNPITGHLVAADIVPEDGACRREIETAVRDRCARALDRYRQPRLIRFFTELETANQKIIRRGGQNNNEL
jgi:acyl-CoA synthetase (AMP-forming)/AMP-acid ligase II